MKKLFYISQLLSILLILGFSSSCTIDELNVNTKEISQSPINNFKINKLINDDVKLSIYKYITKRKMNISKTSNFAMDNFDNENMMQIKYNDNHTTAYVSREFEYNDLNQSNLSICYIMNDSSEISDNFYVENYKVINTIQKVKYYDSEGNLGLDCEYDYNTNILKITDSNGVVNKLHINWKGVKNCMGRIYHLDNGYGALALVISTAIPETYAAVLAGCIGNNLIP